MRKFYSILSISLVTIIFSSCAVFLQKNGLKNYSLPEKINSKGLNHYQYDFIYLTHLVKEAYPMIDSVFLENEREEIENGIIEDLSQSNLHDKYFVLKARQYLSHFHNQHTNLHLKSNFDQIYPYVIHIYKNKWFLLNVDRVQDSLFIGKEITKLNGVSIPEVENRLAEFTFAENKISQENELELIQLYNKPICLKEIGVINDVSENLSLTFKDSTSTNLISVGSDKIDLYRITIPQNEITQYQNTTYFYKSYPDNGFGYMQFNKCHDKIDILEGIENYVKPWLQPLAKRYAIKQFKKGHPSKQISEFYNPKHPIFKDFVWQMIDSLNRNKVKNLVIDLRNNDGGNLTLCKQLLYFLTEKDDLVGFKDYAYTSDIYKDYFPDDYKELQQLYPEGVPDNQLVLIKQKSFFEEITNSNSVYYIPSNRPVFKGNVYLLSNYNTGSAAAMLTTLFQDNQIGTVIGTSVGNNPTGATTLTPFVLPKTKATVSIASTYIERPIKSNGKVQIPDYWIEVSLDDIVEGKDPCLEKAVELFNNK